MKDVVGQKVYYYKVREDLSKVHEVYEESENKVFDLPVELDARVEWFQSDISVNEFGIEEKSRITVWLQYRDIMHKQLDINEGDFLSYGETFFEVLTVKIDSTIYGQIEYSTGYTLNCKQSRKGMINKKPIGPTDEAYSDPDATQKTFVQQRGFEENRLGKTGDTRALIEQGKLDLPVSNEPAEVSPRGDDSGVSSSFYADEGIENK